MTAPEPSTADWEAFYQSYRKPGYVPGYEITTKLGGGMFGLVFRARKQSIGKDYAIKFLKVDDGEVRRAVLQELEQVKYFAQVDHPNLVSIEDRGEVDGIPYIVMAYAGHETLRDKLGEQGVDREELLRYFLQACRGVAALHERSLVHFDLKPANVFLKGGVARVGDYGLSKLVAHSRNSLSMGRGTPYYMAPEMLQRRGDDRSDIYSLGVVLYEILTGDVPFKGDSEWEVLRKHEVESPRYPPHVASRYRAVLDKCLAKDPADRYASVHEIMTVLGAPASAGAAAWEDVRAGVDTGPQTEPIRPGAPVPPPPSPDDSYAEFRNAARKAQATARQIALEAMESARTVTSKAMRDARTAMHDAVGRYKAGREKRRQRRMQRQQECRTRCAPEGWPDLQTGKRRRGSWWGVLLVVAVVAFWLMWSVGPRRWEGPRGMGRTTAAESSPAPFAPMPPEPAEPAEAVRAEVRLSAESMQRRLEEVRAEVAELQERPMPPLQTLVELHSVAPKRELVERLKAFSAAQPYDVEKARKLIAGGYPALRAMVTAINETPVTDPVNLRRAMNLHRLLEQATGFDVIELSPDAGSSRNARAGLLWVMFLERLAPEAKSWQEYQRARER